MKTAIIATSRKENEKRVPIHPKHIGQIPRTVRNELFFERGYGEPFGVPDSRIAALTGNEPLDRNTLLTRFASVIITKPVEEDFEEVPCGGAVWGWIHSVQQRGIAQAAVDRKLTLVAWENMYHRSERGRVHIFQKNNEMAGYCSVQHALQLRGIDGNFGPARSAAVLGFGSVSRGAVCALKGHGIYDITVLTQRPEHLVADKIPGVRYVQMRKQADGRFLIKSRNEMWIPLIEELIHTDILVNGVLQNPNAPSVFIHSDETARFTKECLVIDISCDMGMGFSFAHPADFAHPLYRLGNILYYSVDHTPALLWDSATWEISAGLLPYLPDFVQRRENPVLKDAVDIRNGIILNKDILTFQGRSPIYPYLPLNSGYKSGKMPLRVEAAESGPEDENTA